VRQVCCHFGRPTLTGVTAAVVGMIANLAVFFAGRVSFPEGVSLGGLDLFALVAAAGSFAVLQRFRVPIYALVPVGAVLGMAWTLL
jgi:chromate transporter